MILPVMPMILTIDATRSCPVMLSCDNDLGIVMPFDLSDNVMDTYLHGLAGYSDRAARCLSSFFPTSWHRAPRSRAGVFTSPNPFLTVRLFAGR